MPQAPSQLPIRIALADDHAVVRAGYRRLLECETNLQVCAEYVDGETAYTGLCALAGSPAPVDLLILDLSMPGRGGMATLQRLAQRLPALKILIFSMHEGEGLVLQALRAGAHGYLSKSSAPEALISAVFAVMQGTIVLAPEWAGLLAQLEKIERGDAHQHIAPHAALSPKEFEIFRLLAQGESVDEVAQRLYLSSKTASNYQTIIRKKTGLSNAVEMHRYAVAHQLL